MLNPRAYERVCEGLLKKGIKSPSTQESLFKFLIKLSNKTMSETFYYYAAYLAYSSKRPDLILEFEENMKRDDSFRKGTCKEYYYKCIEELSYSQNGILVGPVTKYNLDLVHSFCLRESKRLIRRNMDHLDYECLGTISLYKSTGSLCEKEFKLGAKLTLLIMSIQGLVKDVLIYITRLAML